MEAQEFEKLLNQAKELQSHVNNELQDHYVWLNGDRRFETILCEQPSPVSVFNALKKRKGYYTTTIQTFRENGTIKPKSEWKMELMFHKKWARIDKVVTDVEFNVVGLKRRTTHLSAGVLISNIQFKIN